MGSAIKLDNSQSKESVCKGMEDQAFICISSTHWDGKWERMQQLSLALSKRGKVLYLEPVVSVKKIICFIKNFLGLIAPSKFLSKKTKNLYVYQLVAIIPFGRIDFIKKINYYFIKRAINVLEKELKLLNCSLIVWDFWEGLDFCRILDKKLVIFDYFDNYLEYHDYSFEKKSEIYRRLINTIQESDIVFASAQNLYQEVQGYHKNVHLLPNGVAFEDYIYLSDNSSGSQDFPRPIIGYMGGNNFSTCRKIDFELLDFVTDSLKEVSFVFIGPLGPNKKNEKLEKIKLRKNVFFVGHKDHNELPLWLKKCAVFILPWKLDAFTGSVYPLKLNEYFACGKPVVSTRLASLVNINRKGHDLVYFANDCYSFVHMLKRALKEKKQDLEIERINIAKESSWDNRAEKICEAVKSFLERN